MSNVAPVRIGSDSWGADACGLHVIMPTAKQSFHGEKELFESNHQDWVSVHAVHGASHPHVTSASLATRTFDEVGELKS
jgi:hypothetical protein